MTVDPDLVRWDMTRDPEVRAALEADDDDEAARLIAAKLGQDRPPPRRTSDLRWLVVGVVIALVLALLAVAWSDLHARTPERVTPVKGLSAILRGGPIARCKHASDATTPMERGAQRDSPMVCAFGVGVVDPGAVASWVPPQSGWSDGLFLTSARRFQP